MFYTSGTTGKPKGVRGSLAGVGGDAAMWQLLAGSSSMFSLATESPVYALAGPAYHSAQWVFAYFSLISGATVTMQHSFDPEALLALLERDRVTNTFLVPTQFTRMLRLDDDVRAKYDLSNLVAVHHGGAPCSPRVKRAMIDWLGPVVWEFYGGTEGGFISMISADEWLERPTSVGRIVPIVEVFVADDDGRKLGPNEPGNLWFKSIMGTSFEYHNAPEKTADAHLEPGVATLGDIGYFDDDGFLYLSDRKIDMIISGGVNIYPPRSRRCSPSTPRSTMPPCSASPTRSSASRSWPSSRRHRRERRSGRPTRRPVPRAARRLQAAPPHRGRRRAAAQRGRQGRQARPPGSLLGRAPTVRSDRRAGRRRPERSASPSSPAAPRRP